ncbi:unnamed protein product [Prunus armeniaca]|uniref:Uncharacterized protein n=1 Tax=Prunus armeniaca TaxID=36596 RepID=A0A6J5VBV4_PRUAR|nr:unnamed protein product [Prunus armeniaca]
MADFTSAKKVSIKMLDSVEQGVDKLRDAERRLPTPDGNDNSATSRSKSKIQSVPRILRSHSNLVKCFEPRVLAMGPIHHGKCKEAEELKYTLAADFIKDCGCTYNHLYETIQKNILEIKDCYDSETTKCYDDDEALAWMLFIDGCSTLQFIHKYDCLEEFGMNATQVAFARLDLFLLENQLPYRVLKLLKRSSRKEDELNRNMKRFAKMQIAAAEMPVERQTLRSTNFKSLMDFVDQKEVEIKNILRSRLAEPKYSTHLLDFLRKEMLGPSEELSYRGGKEDCSPSFRNAQELKAAGVHFRRSKTISLKDVSFTSQGFTGFLSLPPINEDAMSLFLNLIAYEMCPDFRNDFAVTSYFGFLSSLIAHPEDAKQLRSARILCNLRGSDEALADLFHEIGPDLVLAHPMYKSINAKLEQHYKTKWKAWFAQFFEDHFSSPWAMLAFIGALIALILSGIQTWYAVLSFYQK